MNASPDHVADQPLVALAIGPDRSGDWNRLIASLGVGVKTLVDTSSVRFAVSSAPGLESVRGGWCWGRHIQTNRRPVNPRDAAHELDLAGFWWDGQAGVLHTGLLGVQELYVRTIGDTTFVTSRISPLASIGPPMDVDWEAWALFLSINCFHAEDTGFAQIRRLPFASRLEFTASSLPTSAIDIPGSLLEPDRRPRSVDDLWDSIRSSIRPRFGEHVDITLSGGLDSRLLLAALNRRRSVRISAWTTHGSAGDFELGATIAAGRTRAHVQVDSTVEDWCANFLPTLRQLEHETSMHAWLQPLSRAMRHRTATLYDGFGANLILHARQPTHASLVESVWHAGTGGRWVRDDRFLSPEFREKYGPVVRSKWVARGDCWSGHPSEGALRRFTTRAIRGIALSPLRIFGQGRRVITPLADPQVFSAVMALPPAGAEPVDYRELVLQRFAPDLHALPAAGRVRTFHVPFEARASAPDFLAHLVDIIEREPAAVEPLDPGLRVLMAEADYPMMKWQAGMLANAAVLSDWLTTWRHRLNRTDQPWT